MHACHVWRLAIRQVDHLNSWMTHRIWPPAVASTALLVQEAAVLALTLDSAQSIRAADAPKQTITMPAQARRLAPRWRPNHCLSESCCPDTSLPDLHPVKLALDIRRANTVHNISTNEPDRLAVQASKQASKPCLKQLA